MNKLINFNSIEQTLFKKVTNNIPLFDSNIALIFENYIYTKIVKYSTTINNSFIIDIIIKATTRFKMKEGLYETWFKNGNKNVRCNYKDGKKDGLCEIWYENGNKWEECNYKDDEKDGLYQEWYENGNLRMKQFYINDNEDGLFEAWWENGNIMMRSNYRIVVNENNTNSIKEGLYEEWYENGSKNIECSFRNSKSHGLYQEWYPATEGQQVGNIKILCCYIEDKLEGIHIFWDINGHKTTSYYVNDILINTY